MFTMFGPFCTICLRVASEDWAEATWGQRSGIPGVLRLATATDRVRMTEGRQDRKNGHGKSMA